MAERGIGRGLAAILPSSDAGGPELRELPVELVRPNPDQPRTKFDPGALASLTDSIAATGVVQPLVVRALPGGTYELIAGERRWRAAQAAGLSTVPAVVQEEGEAKRLEMALVENMVREDLNPIDAARACAALVEDLGLSKEEVGRRVGRSRSAVSNLIRLLDLPDTVLTAIESGELTEGHGRAILQAPDHDTRRRLAKQAISAGWTVRQTEQAARAKAPGRPAKAKVSLHPDQEAAIRKAEDALESALGHQVSIRLAGRGLVAEIPLQGVDEALALASRLRPKRAA